MKRSRAVGRAGLHDLDAVFYEGLDELAVATGLHLLLEDGVQDILVEGVKDVDVETQAERRHHQLVDHRLIR